jgi:hyperosmotically inducible protein
VGTEIDDSVITTKVKSALLSVPDVKSLDIQAETRKGEVQLSGFVDNESQVERALAAARAVEGVKSVSNMMSLKK